MSFFQLPLVIIDDEEDSLFSAKVALRSAGYRNITTLCDPRQGLDAVRQQGASVVILDLMMPHLSGQELLAQLMMEFPELTAIVMTAVNDVETAIECMKSGAFDYIVKPFDKSRLMATVQKAVEVSQLRAQVSRMRESLLESLDSTPAAFEEIVTQSPRMKTLFKYIGAVAQSMQPVLINGETGSGKELFARAVHKVSQRPGAFVPINIAGLDDTMFSDTLFGHTKGAFTGAEKTREGLLARAQNGTIFLDEIGDLSEASQVKLLRLLQEGTYYPLGSDTPSTTNARVVLATNRDLVSAVADGSFRKDLFYRIRTHLVRIPPLRERREDIPLLLHHFVEKTARSYGCEAPAISGEVVAFLKSCPFPGNVRELEALVFDAVARCHEGTLGVTHFMEMVRENSSLHETHGFSPMVTNGEGNSLVHLFGYFPTLKELEAFAVSNALDITCGVQAKAATLLGISKQALNQKLKKKILN
ncbi:sigma-54 factor interaction domain-containing protein [Desulfurispirillum indicum S5]|uniref:Sigma-54 factor interaction domain-containing protein n=1 Tax=Desulfurispirillum indicum (strain ATCC BAA-1389 / DSM 22839 / S5) TaxID=653733 RepID=E6W4Z1_DESIS|nr:sigma-54 dependent transcriptional regulator [Desulfurispirillum indicum]ADU65967.1 sigma-54 factor interaction domain-containing protein [Desulfurispirillum indicum S5]